MVLEERPPLTTLLNELDREQLQGLLLKLVEQEPSLQEIIEEELSRENGSAKRIGSAVAVDTSTAAGAGSGKSQRVRVDTKAIRRQVSSALHSLDRMSGSEAYYHVGAVLGELGDLVERAWEGIRMDDGRNALAILEAITEEYLDEWEILDGSDGESGEFFNTLGAAFTEAILTADLSKEERDGWMKKLDEWQMAVDDYGIEDAFLAAQEAAARGWDDPPLQAIFQGRTEDAAIEDDDDFEGDEDLEEDEEDEDSDYADELTRARLHILERRGQWQQYLNLAKATGQTEAYTRALVNLGRVEEAIAYSVEQAPLPGAAGPFDFRDSI